MKSTIRFLALFGLVLLSGCGGVKEWVDQTFDQGKEHKNYRKTVKKYLKSISIYDQFTTVALFDVMWLSDQMRILYSDVYGAMHGRGQEVRKTFLRRQLKANDYFVSFYVLSTDQVPLNLQPTQWAIHLEINGKTYAPTDVKTVELPAEYQMFFGRLLTKHKRPYEVRFDRKDPDGNDILAHAQTFKLYFSGPRHYSSVIWEVDSANKAIHETEPEHDEDSNSK